MRVNKNNLQSLEATIFILNKTTLFPYMQLNCDIEHIEHIEHIEQVHCRILGFIRKQNLRKVVFYSPE